MKFQDVPVKAKMMFGFCAMAVMVLVVSGLSLQSLAGTHARFEQHLAGPSHRERLALEVRGAAESRAIAARNLVLVTRPEDRDFEHQVIAREQARLDAALAELRRTAPAAAASPERARVAAIEEIEGRYGPLASAIVKMADEGQREQAIRRMNDECRPLLRALIAAVADFVEVEQQMGRQSAQQSQADFRQDRQVLLLACLLAAGAALALGWTLSGAVIRPLRRAVVVARSVADGDLSTQVEAGGRDETGQLLTALQQMSRSLSAVVSTVRASADGVSGASSEIAVGNNDLSARTEHQASALQQTAATLQHMTATVQQNARHSLQASELSRAAAGAAEQGSLLVQRVVTTMGDIHGASGEIGQIIGVIDGIAFQTNILALNAAVEAARAGEQGRGFAVVAAEVRALARRCADAARQVHQLVGASQAQVQAGVGLVSEAGTMMDGIVRQVREVNGLVAEINGATNRQSTGIAEINQAVASIDEGTQQNAALVEQSAAAAESLKQQAAQLVQVLTRFRTAAA